MLVEVLELGGRGNLQSLQELSLELSVSEDGPHERDSFEVPIGSRHDL